MIQGSWEELRLNKHVTQKRKGYLEKRSSTSRVVRQMLVVQVGDWSSNLFPINSIELDCEVYF